MKCNTCKKSQAFSCFYKTIKILIQCMEKTKLILIYKKSQRLKTNRLKINSLFIVIHKNTKIKMKCSTWMKCQAVLLSQNNKNFVLIHRKNKIATDF